MSRLIFKRILLTVFLLSSFKIFAQIPPEFTKLFQEEQYQEAIDLLNAVAEKTLPQGKKDYLIGLSYSRLRKYDQAVIHFKNAVKEEDSSIELDYEYGQALYAINSLKQARYKFSRSAGKNFNYIASVYYVAYISELLDDVVMSKYSYGKLIKDGRTDKKLLQISLFQYTKILLKMMKSEEKSMKTIERNLVRLDINLTNTIPRYITPLLIKARDVDPSSQVGIEIDQFMNDLIKEFKLDPNTLANGRRISPYRLNASVTQRLKYDDNVATTKKASTLYETETFAKYDFVVKKKVIIAPELRLIYTKHKAQKTPDVYKNDSFSLNSALRNNFEHTYNGQPASFLLDMEFSSIYKDWKIVHQQVFFSRNYSFGIGEKFFLINSGETTFRLRQSGYMDKMVIANNKMLSISAEQYLFLKDGQYLFIATLDLSKFNYYKNETSSYNSFLARIIYLAFEIVPTYTLQMIFAATLTDPKAQKALRGYELTINPSIDISKALTNKIRLAINYNFLQNSSKQVEYKYQKQVVGTELSYTF